MEPEEVHNIASEKVKQIAKLECGAAYVDNTNAEAQALKYCCAFVIDNLVIWRLKLRI